MRALEEILQLPEESLIRLLSEADAGDLGATSRGPLLPRPPWRPRASWTGCWPNWDARHLTAGCTPYGRQEPIRIGAGRELAGRESHLIVRAHRDGVDRFLAVHHGDPGCVPARMSVHALENSHTGQVPHPRRDRCPGDGAALRHAVPGR
ncbi:XRE family transcriptional regulator OS=Streptomyces alboniger OX=132473 GN=CP975_08300 PE=4 SV=1 [Streptomyces alboniger]